MKCSRKLSKNKAMEQFIYYYYFKQIHKNINMYGVCFRRSIFITCCLTKCRLFNNAVSTVLVILRGSNHVWRADKGLEERSCQPFEVLSWHSLGQTGENC
jgi:hypothetical protein